MSINEIEVSIIVPVYRVEEYIEECVESIEVQDFAKYELILLEDGSPDRCGEMCDELAKKYENIRVIHSENVGLIETRKRGMRESKGKYIVFVDSDDYMGVKTSLRHMYEEIKKGYDIVVGNYSRLWNGKLLPAASHSQYAKDAPTSGKFKFEGFFSVGTLAYLWGRMYRKSFLEEHKINLEHFTYAEDKHFNFMCYLEGANIGFVEDRVYVYRNNTDSISHRVREDSVENWMAIAQKTQERLEEMHWEEMHGDLVAYTIFFGCFFDAKMFYEGQERKFSVAKQAVKKYASYSLARSYFKKVACRKWLNGIPSFLWRTMIWGFGVAMTWHWYGLLALGIKIFVDLGVDQHLSDTGKRE